MLYVTLQGALSCRINILSTGYPPHAVWALYTYVLEWPPVHFSIHINKE